MIVFYEPISASFLAAGLMANGVRRGLEPQPTPRLVRAASPEGDREAERKATEEADRRARAAAATGRQDAILAGYTPAPQGMRRTLLGVSNSLR